MEKINYWKFLLITRRSGMRKRMLERMRSEDKKDQLEAEERARNWRQLAAERRERREERRLKVRNSC